MFSFCGLSVHGDSPGQNTGVSCLLLEGIFPTQGLNPGLPHCRHIFYCLNHQGSPRTMEWVTELLRFTPPFLMMMIVIKVTVTIYGVLCRQFRYKFSLKSHIGPDNWYYYLPFMDEKAEDKQEKQTKTKNNIPEDFSTLSTWYTGFIIATTLHLFSPHRYSAFSPVQVTFEFYIQIKGKLKANTCFLNVSSRLSSLDERQSII